MSGKSKIINYNEINKSANTSNFSYLQSIKNFFARLLVYHMVLIWIYMKVVDIDKSLSDFKTRMQKSISHFELKGGIFDYLTDEPLTLHLLLILSEVISLIFALFGNRLGAIMLGGHFLFTNLLFFNPFLPENSFSLLKFDIRPDMLSSFGVVAAFYLIAYYPYSSENDNTKGHIVSDIEDEEEDIEAEELNDNNQNNQNNKAYNTIKTKGNKAKTK